MIRRLLAALTAPALALAACATTPPPSVEAFAVGMDRQAVMALGSPVRAEAKDTGETLTFNAVNDEGERRQVIVAIEEGRVTAVRDRKRPTSSGNRDRAGDTGSRI